MSSEYSIHIQFDKNIKERPERVFEAMALFIQGFNEVQSELLKGYGESIGFETSLSKTREGSLIADINRYIEERVRAVSLRKLLDGIYFGIEDAVMHSGKIDSEGDVNRFIERVYENKIVKDESYKVFTSPPHANKYKVAKGVKKICEGMGKLAETDQANIGVNNNFKPISKRFSFPRSVEDIFRVEKETFPSKDVLIVRRPDYVGNSKWDFISLKRGDKPVSARIVHEEWLNEWKKHKKQVLPGDALLVMIRTTRITCEKKRNIRYEDEITEVIDIVSHNNIDQFRLELQ